ncbi:MAG: NAD-binding protein [Burkholderiales bacterium]|nr:NAD-binding protein [Burkholderiales bacterium]
MSNSLFVALQRLFGDEPESPRAAGGEEPRAERRRERPVPLQATSTIFLVLRRLRLPLIALILIYAIAVLGLTLVPGVDDQGRPWKMSFFHAFYFMTYTATSIGFGEVPYPFSNAQRMWVTLSIYLAVIGWAYTIATVLWMLRDRSFRHAIAVRRFAARVRSLREPFVLVAGCGRAGRRLARSLDALDWRVVAIDVVQERIDELALESFRADVAALAIDARNPENLLLAGVDSPWCRTLVALTSNDDANLAMVMTVALQYPGLSVIARANSPLAAERMRAFGDPVVINPFDLHGNYLRVALSSPSAMQLIEWLTADPLAARPPLRTPPRGRWIVCGYGGFGSEVAADLRTEGLAVTVIDAAESTADDPAIITGSATVAAVLESAQPLDAVALVAATDDDTTNLSMIATARRLNPLLYIVARQNQPANAPLFRAIGVDFPMIPAHILLHEVLPRIVAPLLARFTAAVPTLGETWAAALLARLEKHCGDMVPARWRVRLDDADAPALARWFATGRHLVLGDLLHVRGDGGVELAAVPLLLIRDTQATLTPADDFVLAAGDEILFVGTAAGRRALARLCESDEARDWALSGRSVPSGWIWRRLARTGR